ncbi:outer membrane beta-barrel protein [Pedobacter sp. GR22-10]|uniref:outer membrane beta-barrel protein n=1 Tax=Pedobacter sp. GR22-10 TaxID=2994472 RepID=UPI00224580CF|nr:outer membrane beta-barrel protein [Pedobacter sp. GR22-10]MCX2433321.1 outer membrane beta-barrel protein [Pedobacter sp. GR22-10]
MKIFLLSAILCFTFLNLAAQKNGSITGILADSANRNSTLNYATVSVYKAGDSILTTYKLSDDHGVFKINGLATGLKYRLIITAWQYGIYRKNVELTADKPILDLGTLYLSTKSNDLDEVIITAERPPVIVRKDTIEFNAASFKTLPSAVVEDLLKKLPGVQIAADGSIMVNGKTVSKILVDGKEFFGGDQQIATKNLPANMIDKVQVVDDKQAKRRNPDLTAAEIPQVINLKLKKAIKKGAFGKLYAGAGTKNLYQAGGLMNFFRDTTQVSVLAYGNNINQPGFNPNDVQRIGGFNRSGVNSMMMSSGGYFEFNGISFGGSYSGIQTSSGGGFNFNTLTKKGIKINTQYFFGRNDNLLERLTNTNQTLGEDRLVTNANENTSSLTLKHNIAGKIDWQIDSLTQLTIEPFLVLNSNNSVSTNYSTNTNAAGQLLNTLQNLNNINSANNKYQLLADLSKDFKKAGRSFNIGFDISTKPNPGLNYNQSSNTTFLTPSTTEIDQLRNNQIENFRTYIYTNYSEPINKKLNFKIDLSGNIINNENALSTFYKNQANQLYDIVIPNLSQTVEQTGFKTNMNVSLNYKITKDFNLQPGVVHNYISLNNRFSNANNLNQRYHFIWPTFQLKYKIFRINYSAQFTEPNVSYLQPVADNTNALYIRNGNPNLLPARTQNVSLNMYKYDPQNLINYNLYGYGNFTKNGIVNTVNISNGVQTVTPINASGIYSFNGGANGAKDFKFNKTSLKLGLGFWANFNHLPVIVNNIRSNANVFYVGPNGSIRLNLNDVVEINQSYAINLNRSRYQDNFYTNLSYNTQNSTSELIIRYPKKVVFETNFALTANTQQIAGYNNNIKLWNAAITYLFMKNDKLQLKLAVNDILQSNVRRSIEITGNSVVDYQTNNLGRYGMLTLTYNIQNFGQKVGGRQTMFSF